MALAALHSLLVAAGTPDGLESIRATPVTRGRQKKSSWFTDLVRHHFPDVTTSGPRSLLLLVEQHVHEMAHAELILPPLRAIAPALYGDRPGGASHLYTGINNLFKKNPDLHKYSKQVMKQTEEEKKELMKIRADAVHQKNVNQIEVEYAHVAKAIAENMRSSKITDIMVALELASGSRKIELLHKKMSSFAVVSGQPRWMEQIGVAKQKDGLDNTTTFTKPLLVMTYSEFATLRDRVVAHVGDDCELSNKQLTGKYNTAIAKRVKQLFPGATTKRKGVGSHLLREIYANSTYEVVERPPMSRTAWLAKVLGHQQGSLTVALGYQGVCVRTSVPISDFKYKDLLDELQARVTALEQPPQELAGVSFSDGNGGTVAIRKLKRKRVASDEEKRDRVAEAMYTLRKAGVAVTNRNVRKMGLSAHCVNQYYNEIKEQ